MAVDLHLHSTASDGTESPATVVKHGAEANLTTIALTDHDNLDGIAEATEAANAHGVDLIPGTELSLEWPSGGMHLLVYWLEPGSGPLQDRLGALQMSRATRNERMVEALQDLGIDITYEDVLEEAGGRGVGRPHIAAVLIARGVVANMNEAFDRYLALGRPAYRGRERLEPREAIERAHASGAVTSVAHPHTLGVDAGEYRGAFEELAAHGLDGVEAYYAEYEPELRLHLAGLAESLGLVATGGSDYHGAYKPDVSVGRGRGDLVVPDSVVRDLASRRLTK